MVKRVSLHACLLLAALLSAALLGSAAHAAPIHDACRQGDLPAVRRLLRQSPGLVRAREPGGRTPLFYAATGEIARLLLQKGADPNAKSYGNGTPIIGARNAGVVRALLAYGANVRVQDKWGETPLTGCDGAMVKLLLAAKADPTARDAQGYTPLHSARDGEAARLLIAAGLPVDVRATRHKQTPLHVAWNVDVATTLLDAGADIDAVDQNGMTPLMNHCYAFPSVEVSRFLLDKGAKLTVPGQQGNVLVWTLNGFGTPPVKKGLLALFQSKGVKLNDPGVLMSVVMNNDTESLAFLVEQKADLAVRMPGNNETLLHIALGFPDLPTGSRRDKIFKQKLPMVQALIEGGVEIDAKRFGGYTALHDAAGHGYLAAVKLLVEHGAQVNARLDGGPFGHATPLGYARLKGEQEVVEYLLQHGGQE